MAGKTVAQLYVSDQSSEIERPAKELKGFQKIYLVPSEMKTIQFHLNQRSFAFWDIQLHDWHVTSGFYSIFVGQNSRDYKGVLLNIRIKSSNC